ncbi:MAG: hypothetical protein ACWA41_03405 [Putridiphycobacter sp.]
MLNKLVHRVMNYFKSSTNIDGVVPIHTIVNVNELSSHDMIYVYHLLSLGTKVRLSKSQEESLLEEINYEVFYKNFKLGTITIKGVSKSLYQNESKLEAVISNLSKEKYLPLQSLELTLCPSNGFKIAS